MFAACAGSVEELLDEASSRRQGSGSSRPTWQVAVGICVGFGGGLLLATLLLGFAVRKGYLYHWRSRKFHEMTDAVDPGSADGPGSAAGAAAGGGAMLKGSDSASSSSFFSSPFKTMPPATPPRGPGTIVTPLGSPSDAKGGMGDRFAAGAKKGLMSLAGMRSASEGNGSSEIELRPSLSRTYTDDTAFGVADPASSPSKLTKIKEGRCHGLVSSFSAA